MKPIVKATFGIALVLLLFLLTTLASAQSLLDNPDYRKAKELQQKAQDAMDEGDYDAAYEYAEESKEYLKKSDVYVASALLKYKANGLIQVAEKKLNDAKAIKAITSSIQEELGKAASALDDAKALFGKGEYESSMESARSAIAILESIQPQATLPKYYTVRLIPERRDCFWRIAEYPFVYGDPWKWPILYEANKEKLEDPQNPRIIEPGMVFEIPSIAGELREGTYLPPEEDQ